jgi:hypothetical protein
MTRTKLVVVLLVGVSFLFFPKPLISQDNYQVQYLVQFSLDEFSFDKLKGYDMVRLGDGDWLADLGKPMLPSKELRIALPAGMVVNTVSVANTQIEEISGEYYVFPAQLPVKIGDSDKNFVEPDEEVYTSNQPYPSEVVEFVHQGDLAGQNIAHIIVYPLQYVPSEKKLILYTSIDLTIEGTSGYECGDYLSPNTSEKSRRTYEQMVKDMVDNPEDIELKSGFRMSTSLVPPGGPFDHVIITSSSYASGFQPLVDWHTKKGVNDTVITTSWIIANYSGSSNKEKIRNFIIDAHSSWGTSYFLMGGEHSTVPFDFRIYYEGESTPSDQYYSDYDDDWFNEVMVGRATVENPTEVNDFVNKVLKYEKDPPRTDYLLDVLLIGMDLDDATHSEYLKNTIDGYIPSEFNVNKVYDSHGGNHRDSTIYYLNAGQNLVNHADHSYINFMGTGEYWHGWGLTPGDVNNLTNDDQMSVIVSLGCDPNAMDYNDCIAEYFVMRNPYQAGVSFTGNTRSGWGWVGDPHSLSGKLDQEWWRSVFVLNKNDLGQALVSSKHRFAQTGDIQKHCEWTFNLLGEPVMPIWTGEAESLAVIFPPYLTIGPSSFLVHVEDSTTHDPVEDAYVCLWKEDEVYLTDYTDANGDVILYPSPSSYGTMYVTVTKQNHLPFEGQSEVAGAVVSTQPATNVEETMATIHGYLDDDGGYQTTCWLVWDIDSGEPYANSESLGVFPSGSGFYKDITSLAEGVLYYFRARAHNSIGWSSGEELIFLTKPLSPTDLTAEATSHNTIQLTWNNPPSADSIIIERNDSLDWERGEGIEIYRDTGTSCADSGLEPKHHYYYQAWSYCTEEGLYQYSDEYDTSDAFTLFKCGDANADGGVDVVDVTYMVAYLFKNGPEPIPYEAGDVNLDGEVTVSDAVYLISYLFKNGPPPCEPPEN